jgi:hypothetical protein
MTESMPPTFEQTRELNRSLTEKVLDRAESDPEWRRLYIEDSEVAMREAGFPEVEQLQQMAPSAPEGEDEVTGQSLFPGHGRHATWECHFSTSSWKQRYR